MRSPSIVLVGISALSLCGCFASEGQLRMKAAADFDCDKDTLAIRDAGNGVREVNGCGHTQRYVYKDEAKAWLREADAGGTVKAQEQ